MHVWLLESSIPSMFRKASLLARTEIANVNLRVFQGSRPQLSCNIFLNDLLQFLCLFTTDENVFILCITCAFCMQKKEMCMLLEVTVKVSWD